MVPWEVLTILSKPGLGPQKLFRLSCLYHLAIFPLSKPSLTTTRVHSPPKKNAKNAPALQASLVVLKPSAPSTRGWRPPLWPFFGYPFSVLKIHRPQSESTGVRSAMVVGGWWSEMWGHVCKKNIGIQVESVKEPLQKNGWVEEFHHILTNVVSAKICRQSMETGSSRSKMGTLAARHCESIRCACLACSW